MISKREIRMQNRNFLVNVAITAATTTLFFAIAAANVCAEEQSHANDDHNEAHDTHDEHGKELIKLGPDEIEELGIQVEKASSGVIRKYIEVPGEIVVNEDTKSHLSARFPGTVKAVYKKLGDVVKKGEVLALIESNESLTPYQLKSPHNGVIIAKNIAPGEFLQEGVAMTVANLTDVWVNLSIYQIDLPKVKAGQEVLISQGHGLPETEATIRYVSPFVDEATRTAIAQIVLPNHGGIWRPGLFITGKIAVSQKKVPLRIKRSALQQVEGKTSIFLQTHEGFSPTPVQLGELNGLYAEVRDGLTPGDKYVVQNSFVLKAELDKEAFGDGHGH
jgi:cobalt-zinc-cadmium efflux system membrane fusion protein